MDGGWSEWADWGICDVTCGDGTRSRDRTCTNPAPAFGGQDCQNSSHETGVCHLETCPGNIMHRLRFNCSNQFYVVN